MPLFSPVGGSKQNKSINLPVTVTFSACGTAGVAETASRTKRSNPPKYFRMSTSLVDDFRFPLRIGQRPRLAVLGQRFDSVANIFHLLKIPPGFARAIALSFVHLLEI